MPNIQTIPTRLSGCPSEARSLAFDRRCQFSVRDCKPANSLLGACFGSFAMIKDSPDPSASESEKQVSHRPCPIFTIRPGVDSETLLVHAYETLASANVMATELSSILTGPTCNLVLGIQQMIVLAQLSVNGVLDHLESKQ
jgi:hypothetical protein